MCVRRNTEWNLKLQKIWSLLVYKLLLVSTGMILGFAARSMRIHQTVCLLTCFQPSDSGDHVLSTRGFKKSSRAIKTECSSNSQLSGLDEARVIYCAVPAMGHNMESHYEHNSRLPAILDALKKFQLTPEYRGKEVVELKDFKSASLDDITAIHNRAYLSGLEKSLERSARDGLIILEHSAPTYATASTLSESMLAAGAGLAVVDSVVSASKITTNPPCGFALVRPPGHHALPKGPMGFCIFGNVAIAARYVQRVHGLKRVLIFDFDIHHGNGTNDVFYEDPDIFFISTHQEDSYPGTGKLAEVGKGAGEGTTLNLPLPGGFGEKSLLTVFDEVVVPAAKRFKPDIILVSAGYDAHVFEQFAAQVTTYTYYTLTTCIKQLAQELCGGRCVFFLEGGYNLKSLSYSVADTIRAFLGENSISSEIDNPAFLYEEPLESVHKAIAEIKAIHSL